MAELPPPAPRPRRPRKPLATRQQRGYTQAYLDARDRLLRDKPICEACGLRFAQVVHHLDHNPHNNHPTNHASWCERCHIDYHRQRRRP